jgi:uncharacterized cupin superfamily protein
MSPRRVVASWYSFVSQRPSWLPNHGPAGLPLSPPGITCTAFGSLRKRPDLPVHRFPHLGFTLQVIKPGQPSGLYHAESNQEGFLVLLGECLVIVEGEERPLRAWDFVHCPPGTAHVFVGAGDGPCVIFMTGARTREKDIVYPRSDLARRYRAGVERERHSASDAYAPFPHWQPERPDPKGMPWA